MYLCSKCNQLFHNDMDFSSYNHKCVAEAAAKPTQELLRDLEASGGCTPEYTAYRRAQLRQEIKRVK